MLWLQSWNLTWLFPCFIEIVDMAQVWQKKKKNLPSVSPPRLPDDDLCDNDDLSFSRWLHRLQLFMLCIHHHVTPPFLFFSWSKEPSVQNSCSYEHGLYKQKQVILSQTNMKNPSKDYTSKVNVTSHQYIALFQGKPQYKNYSEKNKLYLLSTKPRPIISMLTES